MTIFEWFLSRHYNDIIMGATASQITSLTIVYSIVYSDVDQRKHQSSTSLAFVRGISPGTGEFPAQMASNVEHVSIWWQHHVNTTEHISYAQHHYNDVTMYSSDAREIHWADIPNLRRISYTCLYDTTFYTNANFEMKNFYNEMFYLFFLSFDEAHGWKPTWHLPPRLTFFPCYSGLPHWRCGNHMISAVTVKLTCKYGHKDFAVYFF